jgi:hypothetical protein
VLTEFQPSKTPYRLTLPGPESLCEWGRVMEKTIAGLEDTGRARRMTLGRGGEASKRRSHCCKGSYQLLEWLSVATAAPSL